MTEIAALLQAIAALLWPAFAFTALFVFRSQIADIARRLKKGNLLGQEIELNESLDQLQHAAVVVEREVAALPSAALPPPADAPGPPQESVQRRIAAEAGRSPQAALVFLGSEIEVLARRILASVGRLNERPLVPLSRAMAELDKQFGLPDHVRGALEVFRVVRNRLLHEGKGTEEDILRAVDSGLTILSALQALPREVNLVYDPGVTVYGDKELQSPMVGVKGVILETLLSDGITKVLRIFPTTRSHFQKGHQVAWEWNTGVAWNQAWYRHPVTGEATEAWSQAMEFIGRDLDDV